MTATIHPELIYSEHHALGGDISATLRGDLDIAAAPTVRERLRATLDSMPATRGLTIDLSRVTFCDASGLAVLVGAYRRARVAGITMTLTGAQPQVTRVLHVTGLDRVFTTTIRTIANRPVEPQPYLKAAI